MKSMVAVSSFLLLSLASFGCQLSPTEDMEDEPAPERTAVAAGEAPDAVLDEEDTVIDGADAVIDGADAGLEMPANVASPRWPDRVLDPLAGPEGSDGHVAEWMLPLQSLLPMLDEQPMSGAEFHDLYCPGMPFCFLDETVPRTIQGRARGVEGYVYSVEGEVTVHIFVRRPNDNSPWQLLSSRDVPEQSLFHFEKTLTQRRPMKVQVKRGAGDLYHFAARWR